MQHYTTFGPWLFASLKEIPSSFGGLLLSGIGASGDSSAAGLDPSFKRIMVYVFVASRGGQNRARIVELLKTKPSNPNRIAERLGLDYKTVQHHIRMLEENGVIVSSSKGTYGAVYFLTPYFERSFEKVREMWA